MEAMFFLLRVYTSNVCKCPILFSQETLLFLRYYCKHTVSMKHLIQFTQKSCSWAASKKCTGQHLSRKHVAKGEAAPECQRRDTIPAVRSRPRSHTRKRRKEPGNRLSCLAPLAAVASLRRPAPPPCLFGVRFHLLVRCHGNATESLCWSEPYSRVDLLVMFTPPPCLITAAASLVDAVGAVQLPLVCDGGAAADLHLHLPHDALPLSPHPPDRVRLHSYSSFREYCCDADQGSVSISGCGNDIQPVPPTPVATSCFLMEIAKHVA